MEQLVTVLRATLSGEGSTRLVAEKELQTRAYPARDAAGELGVRLAQVLAAPDVDLAVRQAAGVALKQYVYERWSIFFDTFLRRAGAAEQTGDDRMGSAVPPAAKEAVRALLLRSLGDAHCKVRLLAAQVLSIVASCDFPDSFPELFGALRQHLDAYAAHERGADSRVHGALKFLSDFVQVDLDENQLLVVAREVAPLLQGMLADDGGTLSPHIKARCVLVFRQCLTSMYTVRDVHRDAVSEAVAHCLPSWLHTMDALLDPAFFHTADWGAAASWEVLGLRREIVRTLGVSARFRRVFSLCGTQLLRRALENLAALAPLFVHVEVGGGGSVEPPAVPDGDGDIAASPGVLGMAVLTLLTETQRSACLRAVLLHGGSGGDGEATPAFAQLLALLPLYAQLTSEDEDVWAADADAFLSEDDDDVLTATLRTQGADMLEELLAHFPLPTLRLFAAAAADVLRDAHAARVRGAPAWWKPLEAALMLLGATHESLDDVLSMPASAGTMSIPGLFQALALPYLADNTPSFLRGRCFVAASQLVAHLDAGLPQQVFRAALDVTQQESAPLHLKLSAVRAIRNFGQASPALIAADAPTVVLRLGPLLLQASGNTLVLLLDALEAAVPRAGASPHVPADALCDVAQAALQAWRMHTADPQVEMSVAALLETLLDCREPGVAPQTAARSAGFLATTLQEPGGDAAPDLLSSTASLLRSVLHAAPAAALDGAVDALFPPLAMQLLHTDDAEATQSLVHCVTLLAEKRAADLLAWRSGGQTSLEVMLRIVERLLARGDEDACGMPLGTLLVTLFVQAGPLLGPVMPGLVQALANKITAASSAACILALLYPVAFLVAEHTADVLRVFAEMPPAPTGAPQRVLDGVVAKWLAEFEHVHSAFVINVHVLGLTHLVEQWPAELDALRVQGDVIPIETDDTQYAEIPARAKALQLLAHEWDDAQKKRVARERSERSELPTTAIPDDGAEEWADDDDADDVAEGEDPELSMLYQDLLAEGVLDDDQEEAFPGENTHTTLPGCEAIANLDRAAPMHAAAAVLSPAVQGIIARALRG
ncbi:hypothetical protein MSPP1_002271 [Malassezia sp. CBS 17886]|nr:hypothetical protein MSPP1_002271 [Malassezia sp. CBS 17886]